MRRAAVGVGTGVRWGGVGVGGDDGSKGVTGSGRGGKWWRRAEGAEEHPQQQGQRRHMRCRDRHQGHRRVRRVCHATARAAPRRAIPQPTTPQTSNADYELVAQRDAACRA